MSDLTSTRHSIPAGDDGPPEIRDHTLLRRIGRGSFGEVWLGRTVLGAYRAVKIVYRASFEDDHPYEREYSGIEKFEPVSRKHQGLVDILQVGRNDEKGYFYYVMELADDASGSPQLDPATYTPRTLHGTGSSRQRLPFEECVRLGISLAAAAGYLHRNKLVHRDIKPSNIIFVNGEPKLADVGLVTTVDAKTINITGTLGFLAPELLTDPNAKPNACTDVYSLGKVLYEISTGKDRLAFPDLPTEWVVADDIPKLIELNEVFLKACEKEPADRYQSMAELEADLVLLQSGKSVIRLRKLEKLVVLLTRAAAAVAVLVLVGSVAYYQVYRSRKEATERLATAYIKAGADSIDKGDAFEALLRFTEGLRLHEGDAKREASDRVRLATTLKRCPQLLRMWFQDYTVNALDFSPDGKRVVMGGGGGQVFVRDVETNAQVLELRGHDTTKDVEAVAFDKEGKRIVTASADGTVRVWDSTTGRELAAPLKHSKEVFAAQFSPDGQRVLTAGADKVARIWDWQAGTELVRFTNHTETIRYAAFSPKGRLVVTCGADATAQLWDSQTGKLKVPPLPHGKPNQDWVNHAAFSPDGHRLVTGCFDYTIRFWDVDTGEFKGDLVQDGAVRSVEYSPDGRYLLIGCWDRSTTRLWDTFTRKPAGPPIKHANLVNHARFSPDGSRIVTGDRKGIVSLWALPPVNWRPRTLKASFSADGSRYAVATSCGVEVRDAGNDKVLSLLPPTDGPTKTYFSADSSRLLVLSWNTNIPRQVSTAAQLWNVAATQALSAAFPCGIEVPGKGSLAYMAQLSRDGTRLVTAANRTAKVWDTISGQPVGAPLILTNQLKLFESIKDVFFSPDGRSIGMVAGIWVVVWNASSGTHRFSLRHEGGAEHAEFSPESARLATTCADGDDTALPAQVWDALTGGPLGPALFHTDGVLWASFSPDGRRLATASEDRTAQVWNAATGERLKAQFRHRDQVWFAGFSPDGRWLLTTSQDNTARVWDTETGDPISPRLPHLEPPSSAQFIAGGRRIVTRRLAGDCWIWDLWGDKRPAGELLKLIQLLSQHRIDENEGTAPLDKVMLRQHWDALRGSYPGDFTISAAEILYWHEREAEEARRKGSWCSVLFHLNYLLESSPQDVSLQMRREEAAAKCQTASPARSESQARTFSTTSP